MWNLDKKIWLLWKTNPWDMILSKSRWIIMGYVDSMHLFHFWNSIRKKALRLRQDFLYICLIGEYMQMVLLMDVSLNECIIHWFVEWYWWHLHLYSTYQEQIQRTTQSIFVNQVQHVPLKYLNLNAPTKKVSCCKHHLKRKKSFNRSSPYVTKSRPNWKSPISSKLMSINPTME